MLSLASLPQGPAHPGALPLPPSTGVTGALPRLVNGGVPDDGPRSCMMSVWSTKPAPSLLSAFFLPSLFKEITVIYLGEDGMSHGMRKISRRQFTSPMWFLRCELRLPCLVASAFVN